MLSGFSNFTNLNNNVISFQKKQKKPQLPHSIDIKKTQHLLDGFSKILKEDQQREHPVIEYIKPGTIEKLLALVNEKHDLPYVVGIAGGSASGKTSGIKRFKKLLKEKLPQYNKKHPFIETIPHDSFYYDLSDKVKKLGSDEVLRTEDFDCPDAVETGLLIKKLKKLKQGKDIRIPYYPLDGTCARIEDKIPVKAAPLVMVEGLFTLVDKKLRDLFDLKIFIDASKEVRAKRWWERAIRDRNMKHDAAGQAMFDRAFTNHDKYVEPTKEHADIILRSDEDKFNFNKVLEQITTLLSQNISFAGLFKNNKAA